MEFCEKWADQGKTVIVAALDGTFQRQAFGHVLGLVPLAEEITKVGRCRLTPGCLPLD